ncbi:MAG TPA: MFS transporter [Acidimicrobiales bacterium]|nr:MFS transporter [Acidimicrobiales bacterium]
MASQNGKVATKEKKRGAIGQVFGNAGGQIKFLFGEARRYGELRQTPYGLGPWAVLTIVGIINAFESAAFTVAGPTIAQDLKIGIRGLIGIQTTIAVISIFVGILVAWKFDRSKRAPWVGLGTIVSGLCGMWQSQATSFGTTLAPRAINDASTLASGVPIPSLFADYYPPEARGRVFALSGLTGPIVSIFALALAGPLVENLGWRFTGFILAFGVTLSGFYALVRLREPVRGYFERKAMGATDDVAIQEDESLSLGESWRTVLKVRTLRRAYMAEVWAGPGNVAFGTFFFIMLVQKYGLTPQGIAGVFLPTTVFAFFGSIIGGGLIDYFSKRKPSQVLVVTGVYGIISAFALFILAVAPPLWVIRVVLCFYSFGNGVTGPARGAIYSQVTPPNVRTLGSALGRLTALPSLLIFTPMAFSLYQGFGFTPVLMFGVPFIILSAIIDLSAAPLFDLDRRNAIAQSMAADEARVARQSGNAKLLVCRDVAVEYSGVQVLFGVDFDVEEGEIVALLGTNGAGKSTLLRAICGITEASDGAILFDGRDITHSPPNEIAARHVIAMPGGRGVFPALTVRDNLLLANWLTPDATEVRKNLAEVFEIFPVLKERADATAGSLSGGEQQMLSLAQAFLAKPRMLMIDELSLGLSPAVVGQLIEVVREIHRRGVTIIVVEQSVNVALTLADKAVFMEKGEVRFVGKTADLMRRPDILRAVYVKGTGALTDGGATRADARRRSEALALARPILSVEGLVKRYGGITAVNEISFDLREGEALGVIGPNGSGKTTLFDLISGYQVADAGRVTFDGVDITAMSPEQRARRKLVRRFQDARMFGSLTVFETILVALEQRLELRSTFLAAFGAPQARRAERRVRLRADRLVELLELGAFRDKFVAELSTGLRRIVDLACVLAAEPRVLLLDEPSSGIAQAEAEGLGPLLSRVRYETGCSLLVIEHDMPLISAVSDELIALDQGSFVTRGTAEDVLNDERVIESYLGTSEAALKRSGSLT